MKPRDVVREALAKELAPALAELGFSFAPASLRFTRKLGPVKQTIEASINRYSTEASIDFWTMWAASSREYAKWHEREFGKQPYNDALGGAADWNLPGWKNPRTEGHFDLSNPKTRARELAHLRRNALEVGVPHLDRISTWEGASAYILASNDYFMFEKSVDFLVLAGKPADAKKALARAEAILDEVANPQHDDVRALLALRKQRFF